MNTTPTTPGPILFEGWFPPREPGLCPSVKARWDGRGLQLFDTDLERAERDMKLLIAAPELAEALRDMVQWMDTVPPKYRMHPDQIKQARAVLAKLEAK